MNKAPNIRWGTYKEFEGPWYAGDVKFHMPVCPTLDDQIMATITATEGGSWNAINMYDRCICTVGLVQWCEASQYSVSAMIQGILEDGGSLDALADVMNWGGLEFKTGVFGKMRFHIHGAEVSRTAEQRKMFMLESNGKTGSWDDDSRRYARLWVASLAKLFGQPQAVKVQREFTTSRLRGWFAVKLGKEWIAKAHADGSPGALAFVCGYLSFAANNPTWANKALTAALDKVEGRKPFSDEWLAHVFEYLTWHPGVSIYPHRYNKIRPVLEGQFGIDLPNFAKGLKAFSDTPELLLGTDDIQALLVRIGYDLGVSGPEENGVDDVWGTRTKLALKEFETKNKFPADGRPDPRVNAALISAAEAIG